MGCFEWRGFRPLDRSGPDYGVRPGMASFAQLELIQALWREWSDHGDQAGLPAWLKRTYKVDSLRFVTASQARGAIAALKAMKARAGAA